MLTPKISDFLLEVLVKHACSECIANLNKGKNVLIKNNLCTWNVARMLWICRYNTYNRKISLLFLWKFEAFTLVQSGIIKLK